jgi:hypothetical protein
MLLFGTLFLLWGCPPENYGDLLSPTLAEITRIHDDTTMSPQEMRSRLAELGLDSVTIDAVLQDKPLANQGGGTLRTAYQKLVAPDFMALTPDEVQLFGIQANKIDSTLASGNITDEQAQAIVSMFQNNFLSSPADVTAFLDTPGNNVPSVVTNGDALVRGLFVNFAFQSLLPFLP